MELGIQVVASCHMDLRNGTQVLWKQLPVLLAAASLAPPGF